MQPIEDIRRFIAEEFPQSGVFVDELRPRGARVRQEIDFVHLRPGGTVAGPVLVHVADVAAYIAILNEIGIVPLVYSTNIQINFLRLPSAEHALIAEAELLKVGKRLVVADVRLFSEGEDELVAQASGTYSIPPTDR